MQLHGPLALLLQIFSRLLYKSVGFEHRPSQAVDAQARERTADSSRRSASTAALHVAAASASASAVLAALPPAATPPARPALTSAVSAARCMRAISSALSARDSHVLASAAQSAARWVSARQPRAATAPLSVSSFTSQALHLGRCVRSLQLAGTALGTACPTRPAHDEHQRDGSARRKMLQPRAPCSFAPAPRRQAGLAQRRPAHQRTDRRRAPRPGDQASPSRLRAGV